MIYDCCSPCGTSVPPVNIVGSPGMPAAPGANGSNGALVLLGEAVAANFHIAGDIPISGFPARYIILHVIVESASGALTPASGGIYTAAAKAGTVLVLATQIYTAVTGPTIWLSVPLVTPCTPGVQTTGIVGTDPTLYLYLDTPSSGVASANVRVYGYAL